MHAVDEFERNTKILSYNLDIVKEELSRIKCNICDQNFTNKSTLANHVRNQHATSRT